MFLVHYKYNVVYDYFRVRFFAIIDTKLSYRGKILVKNYYLQFVQLE